MLERAWKRRGNKRKNNEIEQENYNKSEMIHNNEISNIQYQEEDVTENKQTEPNKESIENEENSIENKGELNENTIGNEEIKDGDDIQN